MHVSNLKNKHRFLVASLFACMLTGCGDPNRSKIIGTWEIQRADTVLSRISQSDSEAVDRGGESEIDSADPKMTLRFLLNGRLETSTSIGAVNQQKQGTWKLIEFDETTSTMTLKCDIQNQESEHKVEFLDQETIKLIPPNMAGTTMKIKFKRQK